MERVDGGDYAYLPPLREEYEELTRRHAALRAEADAIAGQADAIAAQVERLRNALEVIEAYAARTREPVSSRTDAPAAEPADAAEPGAALEVPVGGASQGASPRDLILRVLGALPAGAAVTTTELHARMRDEYGYVATPDAVRRSAQRMSGRGTLVKVGPALWRLPDPPGGPLNS